MGDEINIEGGESTLIKRHGGKRAGAGRKRMTFDERRLMLGARGWDVQTPVQAADVLRMIANVRERWLRFLDSEDERIALDALKFLTTMCEGKPAQKITITGAVAHLSADDLSAAREIAREIMAREHSQLESPDVSQGDVLTLALDAGEGEQKAKEDAGPYASAGGRGEKGG